MSSVLKVLSRTQGRRAHWIAHDKPNGRAAKRRIRQMLNRGVMICCLCDEEKSVLELQAVKTDDDGAVLLEGGTELGVGRRVACTDCLKEALRESA